MDTPLRGVLLSNVSHIFLATDKGEFVIFVIGLVKLFCLSCKTVA
jgi:hypothetical protein